MLVDWAQELLLLLPLPLILLVNLAEAEPGRRALGIAAQAALYALPAGMILLALGYLAGALVTGGPDRVGLAELGAGFVVAGLAGTAVQFDPLLGWIARRLPIRPQSPVHRLALALTVVLVISQLATQLSTDVLTAQAVHGASLSRLDLILQELPFLLAALFGVGFLVRRGPRATMVRLGLVRPAAWQVLAALALAGAFYAFGTGMDRLGEVVTPGLAHKVQAATDRLFAHLGDPVGILTIALAAGICEEALFRGAIQPRLGLIWVAIVFTSVHTQYGLSIDTVAVLVLAGGLGLVRRFANTTSSMLCHVVYNALVGAGVGWLGLFPAIGLEAVLVALAAAAFAVTRLRQPLPKPS